MQTYLVTGGAGFIGTNIVEELLLRGKTVRVVDSLATGSLENLAPFQHDIEFIAADIRDLAAMRKAVAGVDVVLHQAALPSVQRSVDDPLTTDEVNVTGTLNVLLAARDAGVARVVTASSSALYGNGPVQPKVETMCVEPISPYAVSKLAAECYCESFSQVYGLPTIALRYFNVFGPRQDPNSFYSAVVPRFISLMLDGTPPTIYGDGMQSRDFTYVADVVQANLLAAEAPAALSGAFNVASGEAYTLLELVDQINGILGTAVRPQHTPAATGDVRVSHANIGKIQSELGYAPLLSFTAGLRETVEHLRRSRVAVERLFEKVLG